MALLGIFLPRGREATSILELFIFIIDQSGSNSEHDGMKKLERGAWYDASHWQHTALPLSLKRVLAVLQETDWSGNCNITMRRHPAGG